MWKGDNRKESIAHHDDKLRANLSIGKLLLKYVYQWAGKYSDRNEEYRIQACDFNMWPMDFLDIYDLPRRLNATPSTRTTNETRLIGGIPPCHPAGFNQPSNPMKNR